MALTKTEVILLLENEMMYLLVVTTSLQFYSRVEVLSLVFVLPFLLRKIK